MAQLTGFAWFDAVTLDLALAALLTRLGGAPTRGLGWTGCFRHAGWVLLTAFLVQAMFDASILVGRCGSAGYRARDLSRNSEAAIPFWEVYLHWHTTSRYIKQILALFLLTVTGQ